MAVQLLFTPNYGISSGEFTPGATAEFFLSGTTTPIVVYADEALSVPHTVPLVADASGRFATVWSADATNVKAVVKTSAGVTIYTQDKVVLGNIAVGNAASVSFVPTAQIPETNVQDAIERVQLNLVAPLLDGGIGVTGTNTLLSNFNLTNIASGFYRFNDTTTGDRPSTWLSTDTGTVYFLRENASSGIMTATRRDTDGTWTRRLDAGVWASWVRLIDSGYRATEAQAEAGTSELVYMDPLRTAQAIAALAPAEITTGRVGSANAGLSAGAVGSYAFLGTDVDVGTSNFGGTRAGSQLFPAGIVTAGAGQGFNDGLPTASTTHAGQDSPRSGSWRCLGAFGATNANKAAATLWLRIS